MTDLEMVEAQKDREARWVSDGVERFQAHVKRSEASATPGGRTLLKLAHEGYTAALKAYVVHTSGSPHVSKDLLLPVLASLGEGHVAALVIAVASRVCLTKPRTTNKLPEIVVPAQMIGEALEHDYRFRVWAKDAKGAEKFAVARMKEAMECDPRSWRRRAAKLRERAETPWEREEQVVIGMDLLQVLTDACPGVFVSEVLRYGHKTLRILRMSLEAAEAVTEAQSRSECLSPKWGMMIVKPRPWAYEEQTA